MLHVEETRHKHNNSWNRIKCQRVSGVPHKNDESVCTKAHSGAAEATLPRSGRVQHTAGRVNEHSQ